MLTPFNPKNPTHVFTLAEIWNAACGAKLSISVRFVAYNTRHATGELQSGQFAYVHDQPVGFVLASALPNDPQTSPADLGWIDALAVHPQHQRHGIADALLTWAEAWLRGQGCTRARLGGSLRPFAPGLPSELPVGDFFRTRGYQARGGAGEDWDVARDLSTGEFFVPESSSISIRPAHDGDENALLEFFMREFPNRWRFEHQEFLRERGRMSDYIILLTARGVEGFARITFEDSERPIERFYMQSLPQPRGQLGPLGVSKHLRGRGYGALLVNFALCKLKERGVRGCVIDWTDLVEFYAKFGFKPYRKYLMLIKQLV